MVSCPSQEPQWDVIQLVLMELPQWLENRSLLLSCQLDLNVLGQQLCSLVQQPEEVLRHVQSIAPSLLRTQVANLVYPVRHMTVMCRSCDFHCFAGLVTSTVVQIMNHCIT